MEVTLNELVDAINNSGKALITFYLVYEMGLDTHRFMKEEWCIERDKEGKVFFQYADSEDGYYVTDDQEFYREEPDEGAKDKYEVRDKGRLLLEIRLY